MKPMIKYRGGKVKEIPFFEKYIPRFTGRYIEPFFGGGAVYFHLEPRKAIINDINGRLMNFYRSVRDDFIRLKKDLNEIEAIYSANHQEFEQCKSANPGIRVEDKNEAFYYSLRAQFNGIKKMEFSEAALYYFINKTAYSGMIRYNADGKFNVPFGRYAHLNTGLVSTEHHNLLQRSQIYSVDFNDVFNLCQEEDFMFLDPPYDCVFSDYGNEQYRDGFNDEEHERLAKAFFNLPCKALMIIGRTPVTEILYRDSIIDEYKKNYAVNIRNRFKSGATHIIVANYNPAKEVNDWCHALHKVDYAFPEVAQPLLFDSAMPENNC